MEYFLMCFIIAICIAGVVWAKAREKSGKGILGTDRKCLSCGFEGRMKTWLSNYSFPLIISIILLVFFAIPGLIFIAWGWKKYKCPNCGALDKNTPILLSTRQQV
jgi:hypothetical protein